MTIETIIGYDATSVNEHLLPLDMQAAGYDTQAGGGTGNIAWTPEQFARHMKPYPALHIDQNPAESDSTWDYIDVESGAFTVQEIPGFINDARQSFNTVRHPGQRWPGVYCSLNSISACVTELHKATLVNVPFIVADYSVPESVAVARVQAGTGPYPAVGYQFSNTAFGGLADMNVWSVPWLTNVAHHAVVPTVQSGWVFCHKCRGLFYGPDQVHSACPAGGQHDGTGSYDYALTVA